LHRFFVSQSTPAAIPPGSSAISLDLRRVFAALRPLSLDLMPLIVEPFRFLSKRFAAPWEPPSAPRSTRALESSAPVLLPRNRSQQAGKTPLAALHFVFYFPSLVLLPFSVLVSSTLFVRAYFIGQSNPFHKCIPCSRHRSNFLPPPHAQVSPFVVSFFLVLYWHLLRGYARSAFFVLAPPPRPLCALAQPSTHSWYTLSPSPW